MTAVAAPQASPLLLPAVRIRALGPPDAPLLDQVLAGMSDRSRYTRFHGPKPRLSARDRTYLSATDGCDHLALIAFDADGAPLGIARSVRLRDRPDVAEIAAEVVDPWQRRGLGSRLLGRLARQAAAAGIARFSASVLASTGLAAGLRRRGWKAVATDGRTVTLEIDVWRLARQPAR